MLVGVGARALPWRERWTRGVRGGNSPSQESSVEGRAREGCQGEACGEELGNRVVEKKDS